MYENREEKGMQKYCSLYSCWPYLPVIRVLEVMDRETEARSRQNKPQIIAEY